MDWFDALNATGQVALQTYGQVQTAKANAAAAPALAAAAYANQTATLNNALAWRQFGGSSGGWSQFMSSNGLLLVMVGVVALFIINQANK